MSDGAQTATTPFARGPRERRMVEPAKPASYHGRPILKQPAWTWEVPGYLFTGGLAGASGTLSAAALAAGNQRLARHASVLAFAGVGVSAPLLIADLGRPARFLNMLRVFKPSSAMSVGSWLLSAFGATSTLAAGWQVIGVPDRRIGIPATAATAALGPLLSTYTAVLIAQTSVPVWHEARRTLPFVFAGSSLASAGGAAAALTGGDEAAPARVLAVGGAALELAADVVMERRLHPKVGESYADPAVRRPHLAARACTLAGAAMMLDLRTLVPGAVALCAGSLLERTAVIRSGRVSAKDPAQTVVPQRERAKSSH